MKRVALLAVLALAACDDRQTRHEPDPTFARMIDQRRADPYDHAMLSPPPHVVPHDVAPETRPAISRELLVRGRERFELVCGTCHGVLGGGETVVAARMTEKPPTSLHDVRVRTMTDAQLYDVVTNGKGMMPGYANMLEPDERWAVVSYVRALELSQSATVAKLPDDVQRALAREAP